MYQLKSYNNKTIYLTALKRKRVKRTEKAHKNVVKVDS